VTRLAAEVTRFQTRLLKCDLAIDECRAYWQHASSNGMNPDPEIAFSEYWFGARSLPRVRMLLATLRERFDAWPDALRVLAGWQTMSPSTRRCICHWHLQLADPLYRLFTGVYLPQRRAEGKPGIRRTIVVQWIDQICPERWRVSTRIQFTRKLIHSAEQAGLLVAGDDAAEPATIRVDDFSLTYLMYLLRFTQFAGTSLQNPYIESLGLDADEMAARLRRIPAIGFQRQSGLQEFNWQYDSLEDWARCSGILATGSTRSGEVA
jgi:hypothetical protein